MVTRIIGKEDLNASTMSYNSYKFNAQAYSIINKVLNIKDKDCGEMHQNLPWSKARLVSLPLDACGPLILYWTCAA
jgi:hypothetical protein